MAGLNAGYVDVHHHFAPPSWLKVVNDGFPYYGGVWEGWSTEGALAKMDAAGIQTSMLSITTPGLTLNHDPATARRFTRECNEYAARMATDHPGRFGSFVALPLPDIEGSLTELAYGLDTLKAAGVSLFTSYGNTWLGDPPFAPLFEELNRRKAIVFVHPDRARVLRKPASRSFANPLIEYAAGIRHGRLRNVIFSGSVRRYPDARIIWSHAGGAMPFLAWRFKREGERPNLRGAVPDGFLPDAQRFYYMIPPRPRTPPQCPPCWSWFRARRFYLERTTPMLRRPKPSQDCTPAVRVFR